MTDDRVLFVATSDMSEEAIRIRELNYRIAYEFLLEAFPDDESGIVEFLFEPRIISARQCLVLGPEGYWPGNWIWEYRGFAEARKASEAELVVYNAAYGV